MVAQRDVGRGASAGMPRRALAVVIVLAVVLGLAVALAGRLTGPRDGTTTMATVADELPPGVVVDGANEVESTVARQGDAISAAVTYVVDRPVEDALTAIDEGLGDDWVQRTSSSDGQTEQVLYDGPDEATLTVSARATVGGTAIAAVLARG